MLEKRKKYKSEHTTQILCGNFAGNCALGRESSVSAGNISCQNDWRRNEQQQQTDETKVAKIHVANCRNFCFART